MMQTEAFDALKRCETSIQHNEMQSAALFLEIARSHFNRTKHLLQPQVIRGFEREMEIYKAMI